jgi:TRAP-type C4-dicarboxylate transport system permease small subunit
MGSIRFWRWLALGAVLFLLVPARLAISGALEVQVLAAAAGALMATGGVGLLSASWPRRRYSELHHLLAAMGFFLLCAGAVAMLAGVGIYTVTASEQEGRNVAWSYPHS